MIPPLGEQNPADIQKQLRNRDRSVHVASSTPSAIFDSSLIEPAVWR
jgi:hypothetical protein